MAHNGQWKKSTRSQQGSCVQARLWHGNVQVGDTKDPDGPTVTFDPSAWTAFLTHLPEVSAAA